MKVPVQVVHRVAPDDHVHAQHGPFAEDRIELVGGAGILVALREAEVVFAPAQVAEPRQVVDEQEQLGAVGLGLLAASELGGDFGQDARHFAPVADIDTVRQDRGDLAPARPSSG